MSETPHKPDPSGGFSSEARELLRGASKPRPMSLAERKIAAQSVAKIAAAPVAVAGGALTVAKLAAGVVTLGVAAVVAQSVGSRPAQTPPPAQAQRATRSLGSGSAPVIAPQTAPTPVAPIAPTQLPVAPTPSPIAPIESAPSTVVASAPSVAVRVVSRGQAVTVASVTARPAAQPVVAPVAQPSTVVESTPIVPSARPSLATSVGVGAAPLTGGASEESPEQRESATLGEAFTVVSSDPGRALGMLDAYDREFPQGRMRDERDFLGVLALQRLGRRDEARARAQALLARSPRGMYAPRLRRLLEQLQ